MSFFRCFLTACTLAASLHAAEDKMRLVRETEALTPEQERAGLHVPPGFTVQLFASEPMINKPINMAFDARGRLWVSSTVEYPYAADKGRWSDPQGTNVKGSRDAIKILEDTDGDGKADKVTDFANELNIPTGVLPWHKPEHKAGCIAWSTPNIWYFADTNDDDIADHREILFGPLGYEKDTHGMCSSFRLGLDGWVYATHGFNNTSKFKAKDGSTLDLHSGNVFRFKPDGSRVELWTQGQVNPFGLCWDRFGNLYSADCHSSPIYQLIRGACYPSFGKPHDGLGFAPVMCEHSHGSTGICGIVYIDGGVWGPEWDDHTFVGNCVTSRVNHDKVTFTGSTPKANEQPDFITSDDPWFRPVDLQLGPDNALYIADFYNRIIGHYEVPLDHPGRDKERGRIWRVVKKEAQKPFNAETLQLDELVSELGSANLTRRGLAVEELVSRYSGDSSKEIQSVLLWSKLPAMQRIYAGWVAERINQAARTSIKPPGGPEDEQGLAHWARGWANKPVLEGTLLLSWTGDALSLNARNDTPRASVAVVEALSCYSGPLARDCVLSLMAFHREIPEEDVTLRYSMLVGIKRLLEDKEVFESANRTWESVSINDLKSSNEWQDRLILWEKVALSVQSEPAAKWLERYDSLLLPELDAKLKRVAHMSRNGPMTLVSSLIECGRKSAEVKTQLGFLDAINNGLSERGAPANPELLQWAQELATQLLASTEKKAEPAWVSTATPDTAPKWSLQLRKCADDTEAQVLQSMIKGGGDEEKRTGVLKSRTFAAPAKLVLWINGHRGPPTAKAHDKNLVRVVDAQSGETLASAFPPRNDVCQRVELDLAKHANKRVRLEVVDGDDGKAYAWLGITRIEPAVISVNDFQTEDSTRDALRTLAVMLQHSAPAALREKLTAYLPPRPAPPPLPVSPEQRKQLDALIVARSAAFAKAKPDVEVGANVFKMNCAACHQIRGEGGLIGPQLDGIGARGPERLCEDILDPNRNVDAHFHLHILTMKDGSTLAGFLKAELGQVNLFADATGKEQRVAKKDIEKTAVTPISLMPPTFGQTLDETMFIDLLGYLLNEKAASK